MPAAKKKEQQQQYDDGEDGGTMLRFTSFSVFQTLIAKNVYSNYLRQDPQSHLLRKVEGDERSSKRRKRESPTARESSMDIDAKSEANGATDAIANEDEELVEEELRGGKTIVIHPGSRNLRIGLASDAYPQSIPHVIARRFKNPAPLVNEEYADLSKEDVYEAKYGPESPFQKSFDILNEELKNRMRLAKRRVVPNAHQLVCSYNKSVRPEVIPDHNDPYRVEWTDVEKSPPYIIGSKALRIADTKTSKYRLCWPIRHGNLNTEDYKSRSAVMADIQTIWTDVIEREMGISKADFTKYSISLIIPDVYSERYVYEVVDLLLRVMGFKRVCVTQESVCTTFGAGLSTALVVDIGAQKTSIGCIEEGMILPDTRVQLKYGGDDITRLWLDLLHKSFFPYKEVDMTRRYEYSLVEELKERYTSLNEADISINLYDFFLRVPGKSTKKYTLKVFDEAMFAPLSLFYPVVLEKLLEQKADCISANTFFDDRIDDTMEVSSAPLAMVNLAKMYPSYSNKKIEEIVESGRSEEPPSVPPQDSAVATPNEDGTAPASHAASPSPKEETVKFQAEDIVLEAPLDQAITQSLLALAGPNAGSGAIISSIERARKFYSSIILVGGGSLHAGLAHYLEQRLLRCRPRDWQDSSMPGGGATEGVQNIQVVPPPRDLDPRILTWKGGSVLSKIDVVEDLWIKPDDWDLLGARAIKDRVLIFW